MFRYITRKKFDFLLLLGAIIIGVYWTSLKTGVSFSNFIKGFPSAGEFFVSMLPPNFTILPKLLPRIIETIKIALAAIIFAALIALPLSFLAAKNTSPSLVVYRIVRIILNFLRSVLIYLFITFLIIFAILITERKFLLQN
ncbi:hypothetical protein ES705_40973 [subsurface metagenome]